MTFPFIILEFLYAKAMVKNLFTCKRKLTGIITVYAVIIVIIFRAIGVVPLLAYTRNFITFCVGIVICSRYLILFFVARNIFEHKIIAGPRPLIIIPSN